tara:strand:+ start:31711 stop:32019 length:309 start_codon:yes stop_codon:yes gene_type:complete
MASDLISPLLDNEFEHGYISIKFYTDGTYSELVAPESGVAIFTGSEDGEIYGSISNGALDAEIVGVGLNYSRPTYSGDVRYIKVEFESIVGASHAQVMISQY